MSWIKTHKKKLGLSFTIISLCLFFFFLGLWLLTGPTHQILQPTKTNPISIPQTAPATFKLMSLNLAHGRLNGAHQIFLSKKAIDNNLDDVITVLNREKPHITAIQEADDVSWWSGRFNHVKRLCEKSTAVNFVQGHHIQGFGLQYGTGVLTRLEIKEGQSYSFPFSPPTFPKGFVLANINLAPNRPVDVVSVHLDFLLQSTRTAQVELLIEVLSKRPGPMILMGDLNAEWQGEDTVRRLCDRLKLKAFKGPEKNPSLITFPLFNSRIDWILISSHFEFVSHSVLQDTLSDHRALVATIRDLRPVKK
jgi:endonuclease/exonuclease/phosphatase family metal-dependent hydrolase